MPKLKKSWTYYYMQIARTDPWVQTELARPKSSRSSSEQPAKPEAGTGVAAGGYRIVVRTPIRCRR